MLKVYIFILSKKKKASDKALKNGEPGGVRTPDPRLRRARLIFPTKFYLSLDKSTNHLKIQ